MNRRLAAACGWLSLLLLAAAASGCAGAASKEKPAEAQIALIAPQRSGALADSIRLGAEAAAKEYGSQLLYMDANVSDSGEEGQLKAAQRAIALGASVLLLDPDSEQQLRLIAAEAGKAGASVVTLNDTYPVEGVASSISINNREAGRMAGEAMAELLHGKGIVSLLGSDSAAPGYEQRELGVVEALGRHKEITVHTGYSCGSSPDGCAEAARLLMEQADGVVALQEQGVLSTAQETVKRGCPAASRSSASAARFLSWSCFRTESSTFSSCRAASTPDISACSRRMSCWKAAMPTAPSRWIRRS